MNLDDLRGELEARSHDPDSSEQDLRPGIEHKIRTAKRRRTAIVVASAATAIALVVAAPLLFEHNRSRPGDPVDRPTTPGVIVSPPTGDVSAGGLTYRKQIGGRTLLAAVLGEPGQHSITLRWKVSTTNVLLYLYCGDPLATSMPWRQVAISLNRSTPRSVSDCVDQPLGDAMLGSIDPVHVPSLKLQVGSTLEWSATFVKPGPSASAPSTQARLGLAIYDQGEERQVPGGTLEVVHQVDGKSYRLKTVTTASISHGATITIPTPAHRRFFVRLGGAKVRSGVQIRLEGIGRIPTSVWHAFTGTGIANIEPSGQAAQPRPAGMVTLRVQVSKPTSGTMFLALYEADQ